MFVAISHLYVKCLCNCVLQQRHKSSTTQEVKFNSKTFIFLYITIQPQQTHTHTPTHHHTRNFLGLFFIFDFPFTRGKDIDI